VGKFQMPSEYHKRPGACSNQRVGIYYQPHLSAPPPDNATARGLGADVTEKFLRHGDAQM
jgi:hypothetical protein